MVADHTLERSVGSTVSRRSFLTAIGGASITGTAGCLGQLSEEEEWPSRQVEIVSPWAAGGSADSTSRAIADAAENYTEVSWNVSNQTGGAGSVGMSAVANSDPDGHTLGCLSPEICLFEHLGTSDLSPDDITPIMQYTETPAVVVTHQDSEYTSLDEFITFAEENPGEIQMGNSGTGASWHLAAAGFAREAGIEIEHVPYDGANPAVAAVVNREVDATTAAAPEVGPQVQDGPLTALGVMFNERLEVFPDTPTMQEQGVDVQLGSWLAGFGPGGLPEETRDSILEVYNSVYEDDGFKEFMDNNNYLRVHRGPDELSNFLNEQYEFYGEIVNDLGLGQ